MDSRVQTVGVKGFDEIAVEKVDCLLALLEEIALGEFLYERFSLHGGTALNLFMLDAPRLSLDADLVCLMRWQTRLWVPECAWGGYLSRAHPDGSGCSAGRDKRKSGKYIVNVIAN